MMRVFDFIFIFINFLFVLDIDIDYKKKRIHYLPFLLLLATIQFFAEQANFLYFYKELLFEILLFLLIFIINQNKHINYLKISMAVLTCTIGNSAVLLGWNLFTDNENILLFSNFYPNIMLNVFHTLILYISIIFIKKIFLSPTYLNGYILLINILNIALESLLFLNMKLPSYPQYLKINIYIITIILSVISLGIVVLFQKLNIQFNDNQRLQNELSKHLSQNFPSYFVCPINGHKEKIPLNDILYIQSNGHKTIFVRNNNCGNIDSNLSFKEIKANIPSDFIQIHRTLIINLGQIHFVKGNEVEMSNSEILPIGRTYKEEFLNIYNKQLTPF